MSKFGKKFTCWSCSAKFYDLNKPAPKCPKCGSDPAADPNVGGIEATGAAEFEGDLDDDFEGADLSDEEENEDLEEESEGEGEGEFEDEEY